MTLIDININEISIFSMKRRALCLPKKKKNEDFNNYLEVEVIRVNIPLEN